MHRSGSCPKFFICHKFIIQQNYTGIIQNKSVSNTGWPCTNHHMHFSDTAFTEEGRSDWDWSCHTKGREMQSLTTPGTAHAPATLQGEYIWKLGSDRLLKKGEKKKAVMNFKYASAGKSTLLICTLSMQAPVFQSSAHTVRGLWPGGKTQTNNYESTKMPGRLGFF